MKLSDAGLAALREREGVVYMAYRDSAGLLTIGCGHLLTQSELHSGKIDGLGDWRSGLTRSQADALLRRDLAAAEAAVAHVTVPLTQHQHDALVSFAFNVGGGAFLGSTLLRLLNAGDYTAVPRQLQRWVFSGGREDPGLRARRQSEIAQWGTPG